MSTGSTTAVLYIGFTSNELASSQITDYLERVVNPQLYAVNGVSSIDLYGGMKYALRVWLDPAKMAALNLSAADVMSILNANNYQSATGQAIGEFVLYNGSADTQVSTVEDLESLVVKAEKGTVTRLGDIAKVTLLRAMIPIARVLMAVKRSLPRLTRPQVRTRSTSPKMCLRCCLSCRKHAKQH